MAKEKSWRAVVKEADKDFNRREDAYKFNGGKRVFKSPKTEPYTRPEGG